MILLIKGGIAVSLTLETVQPWDARTWKKIDALLEKEGIQRDAHLDYTCALMDEDGLPAATGSCFGDTLRCFAVDSRHQGEGLLNEIVSHLVEYETERGYTHLFLYTKPQSAKFFRDIGFYEVARAEGKAVFLENRRDGFARYLRGLTQESPEIRPGQTAGAVVLNANPFTLGHQYLIERAAAECDLLHVFVVSEDRSLVPFAVREKLVREGTAHIPNLVYHRTGPYLISSATFPSYFLKEAAAVSEGHAHLDAAVFLRIAEALHISCRFLGEEKASQVTDLYNRALSALLPAGGVACVVLPRKEIGGRAVSASDVRQFLRDGRMEDARALLPECTFRYFSSPEAAPVIEAIHRADAVVHH